MPHQKQYFQNSLRHVSPLNLPICPTYFPAYLPTSLPKYLKLPTYLPIYLTILCDLKSSTLHTYRPKDSENLFLYDGGELKCDLPKESKRKWCTCGQDEEGNAKNTCDVMSFFLDPPYAREQGQIFESEGMSKVECSLHDHVCQLGLLCLRIVFRRIISSLKLIYFFLCLLLQKTFSCFDASIIYFKHFYFLVYICVLKSEISILISGD